MEEALNSGDQKSWKRDGKFIYRGDVREEVQKGPEHVNRTRELAYN